MLLAVGGAAGPEYYSIIGSLTPDILVLNLMITKARVLWAETVILSMSEPQDRLLKMSTPRYLPQCLSVAKGCDFTGPKNLDVLVKM